MVNSINTGYTQIFYKFKYASLLFCFLFLSSKLFGQCEALDTSQLFYDNLVSRWSTNLNVNLTLANAQKDTIACLAFNQKNYDDFYVVLLNTELIGANKENLNIRFEASELMDTYMQYSYFDSLPHSLANTVYILHNINKVALFFLNAEYFKAEVLAEKIIQEIDTLKISDKVKYEKLSILNGYLGEIANIQGEFDEALGYFHNMSKYGKQGGNKGIWGDKKLGDVYFKFGHELKALNNYLPIQKKLQERFTKHQYKDDAEKGPLINGLVQINSDISKVYLKQKDSILTFKYLEKGLEIEKKYGSARLSFLLNEQGFAYAEFGNYQQAIISIEKSLDLKTSSFQSFHPEIADSYLRLSKVYELRNNQNDLDSALANYNLAISQLIKQANDSKMLGPTKAQIESTPFKKELIQALYHKALALEKQANRTASIKSLINAQHLLDLATYTIDKIRIGFYSEDDKQFLLEESYPIFEAAIRLSEELYQLTKKQDYRHQAFEYAEKSKGLILQDALKNSGALAFADISNEQLLEERTLRLQLTALEKQLLSTKEKAKKKEIEAQIFTTKQAIKHFTQQIEKEHPIYFDLKYKETTPSTLGAQQLLDNNQTLVEYFLGQKHLYIFVVNAKGIPEIVSIPLEKNNYIEELTDSYRASLQEHSLDTLQQTLAKELYQLLFAPIEQFNLNPQLVIIPDGKIGSIPFDALIKANTYPTDKSIPHYLGLDYVISYNYSTSLWQSMINRTTNATKKGVLGIAPSFPRNGISIDRNKYGSLPLNISEVNTIIKNFSGLLLSKEKANRATFEKEAPTYPIIHLSTHGQVNNDHPQFSFVSFTQQEAQVDKTELLYLRDLFNLKLNADMVTLSACETGIGKAYKGEGIISLARGFAYAGAKSIIPTLWAVNEQSTIHLMSQFYEYLDSGKDKATALQLAKKNLILKDKLPPYYWAGSIAIGDMRPIKKDYTSLLFWGLAVISLLIFLAFIQAKQNQAN